MPDSMATVRQKMRSAVVQMQCDDQGNRALNIELIEKLVGECCASWATPEEDNRCTPCTALHMETLFAMIQVFARQI